MKYTFTGLFCLFFLLSFGQIDQDTTLKKRVEELQISSSKIYDSGIVRLSRKQFLTMAGALEDPTRLLIKTPGISTANDQANSVIYHGMPAQYHQWSLYGARILNPNHNSNAGTISDLPSSSAGGVNMMSGQVIGSLEFNGNPSNKSLGSLAGMSNIKFRNPYKTGLSTNLSLIGLEAGYDRLFGKDKLMVNYRYSTVGILTGLGSNFGGERINYQDLTTKYSMKRESGDYAFYLTAGANSTRKDALDSLITEFKDLQESDYTAKILIGGVNHIYKRPNFEINNTINVSRRVVNKTADANIPINSSTEYKNRATLLSLKHNYIRKYKKLSFGYTIESWLDHQFLMKRFPSENEGQSEDHKIDRTRLSIQPTVNAYFSLSENFSLSSTLGITSQHTGVSLVNFIGHVRLQYNKGDFSVNFDLSRAAQNQGVELVLDSFSIQNQISKNIALSLRYKGFGVNLYRHQLDNLSARGGVFEIVSLQSLDNLPLGYTTLNNNFLDVDNPIITGVSLYTDHTFNGFSINTNLTLQDSKVGYFGANWSGGRGRSPLDYRYILNVRLQKEWALGVNRALGVSTSLHMRGGKTQMNVSLAYSRDWGYTEYRHDLPPQLRLSDYLRADLRIYYKPSKQSTISLDIQNVSNKENDAYYYYEPLTKQSTLKKQLGLIPILSWRVDW
ncbi:MAG: hypothetical protein ACJATI_003713 [Halioglobus sp.]|jgi:hypothetical protein